MNHCSSMLILEIQSVLQEFLVTNLITMGWNRSYGALFFIPVVLTVQRWVHCFQKGREETADHPRPGRPAEDPCRVALEHCLKFTRRWTIRELARECGTNHTMDLRTMKDMGLVKVASKWIAHHLSE